MFHREVAVRIRADPTITTASFQMVQANWDKFKRGGGNCATLEIVL